MRILKSSARRGRSGGLSSTRGCRAFAKRGIGRGVGPTVVGALAVLLLGACSGTGPREYDNACHIHYDNPSWVADLSATERRWGVPQEVILAVMHQESRFDSDAKPPRRRVLFGMVPTWNRQSSAYGYAQVLDGTWDWYRSETGRWFASRSDFGDSADFMGWYMNKTTEKTGVRKTDAYNQYLAYHQGHQGYIEGRHRNIGWLDDVARSVDERSKRYGRQLSQCA